jgi:uncharacterized protein (DUF342 family)
MSDLNADGYFDLRVSQDKLQVLLDVYPPQGGGRNATADEIMAALLRKGIAYGYQFDAIEGAIKHVAAKAAPIVGVLAAQGVVPVHGTHAQIVWKIDTEAASRPLPMRPDGLPDYFEFDPARLVKSGQELATVVPGLPGTAGKTLIAPFEIVPQVPGREAPLLAGYGVRLTASRQRYEADVTGFVELHHERLTVHALSLVQGDIDGGDHAFPGGVIVLGAIRDASVSARGPIAVRGIVQSSSVRGTAHIMLRSAAKSRIIADGDVHIEGDLLDCEVITPASVLCSDGCSVRGGSLIASASIHAFELGAESWPITDAILGGSVYTNIRLREIEHEIEVGESNVKRIAFALKPLTSITADTVTPQKRQLIQTLMDQKRELEQHVRNLHSERRSRQMMHPEPGGTIRVAGRAHPGVRLDLSGASMAIEQCETAVEFRGSPDGRMVEMSRLMREPARAA